MTEAAVAPETGSAAQPATEAPLLQVRDLKVHFPIKEGIIFERKIGDVRAVDGVTLDVRRGETVRSGGRVRAAVSRPSPAP